MPRWGIEMAVERVTFKVKGSTVENEGAVPGSYALYWMRLNLVFGDAEVGICVQDAFNMLWNKKLTRE